MHTEQGTWDQAVAMHGVLNLGQLEESVLRPRKGECQHLAVIRLGLFQGSDSELGDSWRQLHDPNDRSAKIDEIASVHTSRTGCHFAVLQPYENCLIRRQNPNNDLPLGFLSVAGERQFQKLPPV